MSVLVVTATSITHMTVATLRRLLGGAHLRLHVKGAVAATADQDNDADPDNDATADTDTDAVHEPSLALPLSIALIVGEPARGLVGVDPDRTPELYVMCSEAVAEHRSESVCSIEVGVESPADWAFGRREAEAAAVGIGAAIERLQVPAEDDQRRATLHDIAVVFLRSCSPSAQHAAMVGMEPGTDSVVAFEPALVEKAKAVPQAPAAAPKRRRRLQPAGTANSGTGSTSHGPSADDFDALGVGVGPAAAAAAAGGLGRPTPIATSESATAETQTGQDDGMLMTDWDVDGRYTDADRDTAPPAKVQRSGCNTWGSGTAVDHDSIGIENDDDFASL